MPQSAHRTQNTMSINTLRSLIVHSMLFAVATASSCYDGVGDPQDLEICVPSAAVSACCGTPDYCLSNGLCFNAGVNNLLANQGCTDKNWGSPCHNYCKSGPGYGTYGTNLMPCINAQAGTPPSYCCGPNSSCCDTPGSVFSVPVGTIVLRPNQLSPSTSATTSPTSTKASIPTTTTSFSTSISGNSSATSSPPANAQKANSLALGLGLGLRLPFSLILIAAIVFLAWELRKQNKRPPPPVSSNAYMEPESAGKRWVERRKVELPG